MKRTPAQKLAARVSTIAAVLVLATFALVSLRIPYELARELWLIRATGYAALGALFLALSMTPVDRALRRLAPGRVRTSTLIAVRRSCGICAACLALIHAGLTLATYLWGSWAAVLSRPYLRAGLVALAILMVLLLTSFPELVARLRVRMWKQLHRLSYVAAFFLLQHLLMSPFASRRLTLALFGGLLAVEAMRLISPKKESR